MELATRNAKVTPIVSNNLDYGAWESYRETSLKGCTEDEIRLFMIVSQRSGLDPMLKQIYPVKRWDKTLNKNIMTVQTSIDGFRLIAERTGNYAPGREPTFAYNDGKLVSATSYVRKRAQDGTWFEVAATAFYEEYVQTSKDGRPTQFWSKMPHSQLAKCAEALALRKAFPNNMNRIYSEDEMAQATIEDPKEALESERIKRIAELEHMINNCGDVTKERILNHINNNLKIQDLKTMNLETCNQLYTIVKQRYDKWIEANTLPINEVVNEG